jgi:flavin-binding protein dodecin
MSDHVYKKIEVTGSSPSSLEEAIHNAVNRAAKTLHNLRWFEVTEIRGHLDNQQVAHYQVTVKIGFTLDEASSL